MTAEAMGAGIDILLVEDNEGEARLVREAMRDGKSPNVIHHVSDGEEAMDFLRNLGKYANTPRPALILLDLNLPKKDGREVLAELKSDENLKRIPVVVLTVSSAEQDILMTYNLHANCFVTKPFDFNQFMTVVQSIEHFWLTVIKRPK